MFILCGSSSPLCFFFDDLRKVNQHDLTDDLHDGCQSNIAIVVDDIYNLIWKDCRNKIDEC